MNEHFLGLWGKETSGPRWAAARELNNNAAKLALQGRNREAKPMLEAAAAMTHVDDVDAAGLDCRARVLGNLAAIAEGRGEPGEALHLAEQALAACLAAEAEAGDRYGTVAVRASLLINRSQTLQLLGRLEAALADLDAAQAITGEDSDDETYLQVTISNSRSVVLINLERWDEAEAVVRRTLELAAARDPRLTGHPHTNLAMILQSRNELDAAMAHLRLAEQIHTAAGDAPFAALAIANQGRVALRSGDITEGQRLLAAAEQALNAAEQPLRAAELRCTRAQAAFEAGDPELARELIGPAITALREAGHAVMLAEALAVQGGLLAADGEFDAAEDAYIEAWRVYEAAGALYHLTRIDQLRAFAFERRAERTADPEEQYRFVKFAFDLALPAALFTDAVRHGFTPGRAREQWAATVAVPAMAHALTLATVLGDGSLISEILEHMSATVSLHAPAAVDYNPFAEPPAPPPVPSEGELLSFTASALVTGTSGDFPATRFALPPRLRVNPWRESRLEPWIQETERRYGLPIRSDEVIDTW
ncbi:tetratricopeptide repeat protein [Glycomyces albidus]|uniref:Tetratricopeptide repeat protein n=1 Tax=Glycomyces albidus TaxID=2656774 RepID=A0A6L5GAJ3_9ACTN|nr:tetratricopeptide repeat protein [Glycomyces albidus]MQM26707.1 tetratricopeptide repeat protein [Glycomyces albidus]